MNPVVFNLGPFAIRAFTAWVAGGALVCIALVLVLAARRGERLLPWLDVSLAATAGAIIGARAFHVWIEAPYFARHADEILDLARGGLDWHGALFGGLIGAFLAARLRRIRVGVLSDVLAVCVPIMVVAGWRGCAEAACGYGAEVATLAGYPGWLVRETPDIYGALAPRLDVPALGTLAGLALLVVALILVQWQRMRWWRGRALWLILMLLGLSMAIFGFFRADPAPIWLDRRADQVLDLAVAFVAAIRFGVVGIARAAGGRPAGANGHV